MIRTVLIIFLVAFPVTKGLETIGPDTDHPGSSSPPTYPSCFQEDITWSTTESTMIPQVEDPYACQSSCQASATCQQFTWYNEQAFPLNLACFLYDHPTQEYPCTNCVSGPQFCTTSTPTLTTTSPSSITTTTGPDCPVPQPQNHGDWFCPPFNKRQICHLECDPGYVSTNATVITCHHGEWSSAPSCVAAVALITGNEVWPRDRVEVYAEGLHQYLPVLPDERRYHSLDLVDSSVLLCGGDYNSTSCMVMTPSQDWIHHSFTKFPRFWHSSVSALGQLHLLGGYDTQGFDCSSTTEYLGRSSTKWRKGWHLLEDNFYMCTAKVGPELAIMSGGLHHHSSAILYNVTSGAATRLQDLISPRSSPGCCYVKDGGFRGVLLAGGTDAGANTQLYDINTGEWSTAGPLTSDAAYGVVLFVIGDQILASGGQHVADTFANVDRFNLTSRTWTVAEDMLEGRRNHAVTGVPPSVVGIGLD